MDGPMGNMDPDVVGNEVGNVWRSLYKLEKGFENVPAAKKIASKVGGCSTSLLVEGLLKVKRTWINHFIF